jgi:hypothetical protein
MVLRLSPAGAARATALALLLAATPSFAATPVLPVRALDALPSWREGPAKRAILSYVERVSRPGSADYVPATERIATFDNDGTLWPENPLPFQLLYALDTLRERVKQEPALRDDPMVQAALGGDLARLLEGPRHEGLLRVLALTHAGMTTEEFRSSVQRWLTTARHPRYAICAPKASAPSSFPVAAPISCGMGKRHDPVLLLRRSTPVLARFA